MMLLLYNNKRGEIKASSGSPGMVNRQARGEKAVYDKYPSA
jgi:hypothetical protein